MKTAIDPKEETFVEHALAAANRSRQRARVREILTTILAFAAAGWFATRPSSPALGIEATILIVLGAMLAAVTAKLHSAIQRNTLLVLQSIQLMQTQTRGKSES